MTTKIKLANNVADVDLTTTAPTNGQGLIYNSTSSKWVPGAAAGGGVTVYATIDDLPLSGVDTGALALVDSTNKLYLWMDTGWYNIATINTNPSITGGNETPYLLATDGTPTEITLIASDPEGIPLTWSYEVTSGSLTNGGGTTATVSNVDNVFTVTPTTTEAYAGEFSLTFKASDGVNLGTTVAAFTLAFRIPDSNYTTLLAKGVAATQNATFVDSSTNAHTITRNGDVYQGAFSPYRAGGYSLYFDGSGDYLSINNDTSINLYSSNFTVEFWIYDTLPTGSQAEIIDHRTNTSPSGGWIIRRTTSNYLSFAFIGVGGVITTSTIPLRQWTHIAVTYSTTNTIASIYVNGVLDGQGSIGLMINTTAPITIGTGDGGTWSGNLSNIRIVKDVVYTANFDPPTAPLTTIANTGLLINTPYIADSSTNAHAITVNGNTSTRPFSPFNYEVYDEAVNGGSAYFDGTGDYLTTAMDGTFLHACSADWGVEAWVYPTTINSTHTVFGDNISSTKYGVSGCITSSGKFQFAVTRGVSGSYKTVETVDNYIKVNLWCHVAVTFSYSTDTLSLYVDGKLQSTNSSAFSYSSNTSSYPYVLGVYNNGEGGPFYGYIANHRVVNGDTVYTSNFTPPTSPLEAITNTSLLLNFTNAGIQDYSQVSDLKLLGNATGSNTQVKNAAYSMYFDGTGDYVIAPVNTQHDLPADFTIEAWIYPTALSTNRMIVDAYSAAVQESYQLYWRGTGGSLSFFNTADGTVLQDPSSSNIQVNNWHHVAVARSGSTIRMFIDGTLVDSNTFTRDLTHGIPLAIGAQQSTLTNYFSGYIEDLRITKGLARYTSNFTPPTSELLG